MNGRKQLWCWWRHVSITTLCCTTIATAATPPSTQTQPASEPAPLSHDDAARVIDQLRKLRAALMSPHQGKGEVNVTFETGFASNRGKGGATGGSHVTFVFSGKDYLEVTTDTKGGAGRLSTILRAGEQEVRLDRAVRHMERGRMEATLLVQRAKRQLISWPGIPRIPRPQLFSWTYAELVAVPDGRGDDKLFLDALGNGNIRGAVTRDGNVVTIHVWDKAGATDRLRTAKFDLAMGGVPIDFSEHDEGGHWDWSNQLEWRLEDGNPVPTRLTARAVLVPATGSDWTVDSYRCEFTAFSLHPLEGGALSIRAMEIPPGTIFRDTLSKAPDFPYGESNLKRFTGLDASVDLSGQGATGGGR